MRKGWVDKARGVGIILVVVGHAWRGLNTAGVEIPDGLYRAVDDAIYAFHMPFFFLLAGLFLERVIAKGDAARFVADRALRLVWPLMLWTWLFFGLKVLAGGAQNTPHALTDFPIIPLPPQLHFWFLWALFLVQTGAGLLALALGPRSRSNTFWAVLFAVTLAASLWLYVPRSVAPWIVPAVIHAPFVMLGVLIARAKDLPQGTPAGAIALLVFLGAVALAVATDMPEAPALALALVTIFALIVAIRVAEAQSAAFRNARWLAHLGRISMAIYLGHTIFSASIRSALLAAGLDMVWLHLVAGVAAGLAGPAALEWGARRLGLSRALGF